MPLMTPPRLTPRSHRQSLSVRSEIRPCGPTPALFTTMSTRPKLAITAAASARTLSGSETSTLIPVAPIDAAVASSAWRSMSAITTVACSAISCSAMPRPIPAAPPVTTATAPAISVT